MAKPNMGNIAASRNRAPFAAPNVILLTPDLIQRTRRARRPDIATPPATSLDDRIRKIRHAKRMLALAERQMR